MTPRRLLPLAASLAASLAVTLAVALAGCTDASQAGPPSAAGLDAAGTGEYRVDLHVDDVAGRWLVTANGFPVWDRSGQAATTVGNRIDPDLTHALVGRANEVRVEVWPRLRWTPEGPAASATSIRGEVVEVGLGDDGSEVLVSVAGTSFDVDASRPAWERELRGRWERWRSSVGASAARDSAGAWAARNPVSAVVGFDNARGPDFSAVFREAPVLGRTAADSARLRDYAVHLGRLQADRDTAALWDAFEAKYADEYARWGGAGDSASVMAGARSRVVMDSVATFRSNDVELRSWSGGRVWELYRPGAVGLLQEHDGWPYQGPYQEVYVGEGPDGKLRVVR